MARHTNARKLSAKASEVLQDVSMQECCSFSFELYLYSFQTSNVLSSVCLSKSSSHASASAKYPLIKQLPAKYHMTQMILQKIQTFPFQLTIFEKSYGLYLVRILCPGNISRNQLLIPKMMTQRTSAFLGTVGSALFILLKPGSFFCRWRCSDMG